MHLRLYNAILLTAFLGSISLHAQTSSVTIDTVPGYHGWGWKAVVMSNDLITFATVPAIGGRVMLYNLGTYPSLFVNPAEAGHTYTPSRTSPWHNFGGFKTWPAPQDRWPGSWPPPPTLDAGNYAFQFDSLAQVNDSGSVLVSSPVEQWVAPNIRFERRATAFRGSSRIKMEQTMINDGSSAVSWSIWGVSQSIVSHSTPPDYQNFWVYFPINRQSVFGPTGVKPRATDPPSPAWKGEVAPGVYGVQFATSNALLHADPDKGWIAYADLRDSVVFAKTFEVYEGQQYPDSGARVSVYVSGPTAPVYLEVEVKGPIVQLNASGGRYTFTENWWAAKAHGPVLDVDSVGAVSSRLSYSSASQTLTAVYGVFYKGTAKAVILNGQGGVAVEGRAHPVTPLEEFRLRDTIVIPSGASKVEVRIFNEDGDPVGVVDTADIARLLSGAGATTHGVASAYSLAPGYPNPFNNGTVLTFFCPRTAQGSLKIYDLLGKEVAVLETGELSEGEHRASWNPAHLSSGVYLARLQVAGERRVQKLIYLR